MQVTDELSVITQTNRVIFLQTRLDQDYFKILSKFLLLNRYCKGIYVSSNRSARDLAEKLRRHNLDLHAMLQNGQIFVIDLVSKSVGDQEITGAFYVSSPSELSATQMAIEEVINRMNPKPRKTWLVIDSVPTLLIFNGAGALLHFLHFLIGRLRVLEYTGVIFTVEGSLSSRVFSTVAQLCDIVIK